jgi:hypothetical protein
LFAALKTHAWAYPALEVFHLMGAGLLFGSLLLIDLRVWGKGAGIDLQALVRLALPVTLLGFGMALASGLLMFATQPLELIANRAFVIKMVLLSAAGCNAAWFHGRGSLQKVDAWAKASVAASLLIWVGVITCGRWIAYI